MSIVVREVCLEGCGASWFIRGLVLEDGEEDGAVLETMMVDMDELAKRRDPVECLACGGPA